MNSQLINTIKGGIIATAVMTVIGIVAPAMGLPRMLVGNMLAGFMHVPVFAGWIMHFMIGTVLAGGYVFLFQSILPGNNIVRGVLYGLIPFLLAQIMVMPVMGAGFFSSNTPAPVLMVLGSLIGHILYGAVLGFTTREITVSQSYQGA
jgi:uncharacterized membrane protein YagU involved in acid resistance